MDSSDFKAPAFWLKLLAILIAAVMPALPIGSPAEKIVSVLAAVLAALGYTAIHASLAKTEAAADAHIAANTSPFQPAKL